MSSRDHEKREYIPALLSLYRRELWDYYANTDPYFQTDAGARMLALSYALNLMGWDGLL